MFDSMLQQLGIKVPEINGNRHTDDPMRNYYSELSNRLRSLTWENFENLTAKALWEIGFVDVHKLTRGSQQGKDIIGTWISRFTYGRERKFRFQCKHKSSHGNLRKADVGDSISDFLAQDNDEVLVIVTNANLSNDLIDQLDRLCEKNVFAISSNRTCRFFGALGDGLSEFIQTDIDVFPSYSHFFDFRKWFESLLSAKSENDIIFTLYRFWTEPYTWFFHQSEDKLISRIWTTFGGEFSLSIQNRSSRVLDISGLSLEIIKKEELPEFGVINTTPKGGHNLPRFNVELSDKTKSIQLSKDQDKFLTPGSSYSCILDFVGHDPGIYHIVFRSTTVDGPEKPRESQTYIIAYIPDPPPDNFISIHQSWPSSYMLIQKLFELGAKVRKDLFGVNNRSFSLFRNPDGKLVMKYMKPGDTEFRILPEMPELEIDHPLSNYVQASMSHSSSFKYMYLEGWTDWYEEIIDDTEPRAPIRRGINLKSIGAQKEITIDALNKGHERTPLSRTANIILYECFSNLGYTGFARFHLNLAYIAASYDPNIASEHCKVFQKPMDEYLIHLSDENKKDFKEKLS